MNKRILVLLLCMAVLTPAMAGCANGGISGAGSAAPQQTPPSATSAGGPTGSQQDQNLPYDLTPGNLPIITDPDRMEPFKLTISREATQTIDYADIASFAYLKEHTGVDFEFEEIPLTAVSEKVNLMLASQNLPDAFWNCISNEMISLYMDQSVFVRVDELIEKYVPNLWGVYESHPNYKALATAPDGHMYGFPYIEEMYGLVLTPGPFVINKGWLDKVGLGMPTTVYEWADALRAFKAAGDLNGNGKDDEIPYAFGFGAADNYNSFDTFFYFCGAFGQPISAGGDRSDDFLTVKDGEVILAAADLAYKETSKFFHELYKEGLIDVNSFSPHSNKAMALYIDAIRAADAAIFGSMGIWSPENTIVNPAILDEYAPLPRLEGPKGLAGGPVNLSEMQVAARFVITTACGHPEVLARFVDFLCEPEVSVQVNWNMAGYIKSYDEDGCLRHNFDENGNLIFPEGSGWTSVSDASVNTRGSKGPTIVLNDYYEVYVEYDYAAKKLLEWQKVNGKEAFLAEIEPYPRMLKTKEESDVISQIQPQIRNIVNSYRMQWILDGNADATWDQYLKELEAAGLSHMLDTFQKAYDRYSHNLN